MQVFHEESAKVYECKAANICNIMDLATNTIIKYVEAMLNIKVLSLSVDYVIDEKSQLWMLWTSDAKILVRGVLLADAVNSLPSGDRSGRMSWAGPKYFEAENEEKRLQANDPKTTQKNKPDFMSFDPPEKQIDVGLASTQISSASNVVDEYAHEMSAGIYLQHDRRLYSPNSCNYECCAIAGRRKSRHKMTSPRQLYSQSEQDLSNNGLSQFPNPFKCKGDYCNVFVRPVGGHAPDVNYKVHTIEKCFSAKELECLRKNRQFNKMMDFSAVNGPALAAITNRSILLAREELRNVQGADDRKADDWRVYPVTPRQNSAEMLRRSVSMAVGESSDSLFSDQEGGNKAERDFQKQLEDDKAHRHIFTRDMSSYYEPVRVCNVCNKIYMVLDLAREILQKQPSNKVSSHRSRSAGKEENSPTSHTSSELKRMSKSQSSLLPRGTSNKALHSKTIGEAGMTNTTVEGFPIKDDSDDDTSQKKGETHKDRMMAAMLEEKYGGGKKEEEPDPFARDGKRKTWKNYREKKVKKEAFDREKFSNLDDYLRGGADTMRERAKAEKDRLAVKRIAKLQEELKDVHSNPFSKATASAENLYRGKVIVACEEGKAAVEAKYFLENAFFEVRWVPDGVQVLNDLYDTDGGDSKYDCLLIQRDLALHDAFAVTQNVREQEKIIRRNAAAKAAAQGKGVQPPTRRLPIICFTDKTAPEDLQKYMKADMDGCLSMPPNKTALVNTIRAAVPHHLAEVKGVNLAEYEASRDDGLPKPHKNHPKAYKMGVLGTLEGSTDSATAASKQLSVAGSVGDSDPTQSGVVQIDADTRVPYMVMDFSKASKAGQTSANRPFFNLIVCHDMFDTLERMKIFFKPIAQKYLGLQVLLWNYPGQAFTEWRPEQLLNNEYHATCLNEVLGQVGENGTKDFDTTRPFYMLGYGHGTSILTYYASHYNIPNMRGLISINGWAFLDTYLAGVMHDCINVFQTAPPTRPDLPIYFFSRFLFSKEYLAKVSVPLALNLYTAVHNPISLLGRINLCKGVLQSVDVRPVLREIDCPIICLQSTQDSLTRPLHTEPFVLQREGEVRSIFKVLAYPKKTCVIWMKSGHELFQENKKQTQTLIEQILTGFHETHDISFPPAPLVDKGAAVGTLVSSQPGEKDKLYNATVEDKFIDGILENVKSVQEAEAEKEKQDLSRTGTVGRMRKFRNGKEVEDPHSTWEDYAVSIAEGQVISKPMGAKGSKSTTKGDVEDASQFMTYDHTLVSFEKQESVTHSSNNKAIQIKKNQNVADYPEVKEYMGWRLKRNKKRLQRLQNAARTIQGAFRAHVARVFVSGIRRRKAASIIQRCFRGWLGRCAFLEQARRIWAALMIQRAYRGYQGRLWYFKMRLHIAAAATIQRYYRGYLARVFVNALNHQRFLAACKIQGIYRRNAARREAWNKRRLRNAATAVQRVFRGHLGKRKATAERDKYIFSKSQSQGIEFGRQMLLEHKLHATKLQSDVTLLTQEKVGAEEQVEALLEEITSFEEGVRILEKEMHQLAKVEVDVAAYMDEESKYELREQKMRLDREFGDMLGKISNRKDMLTDLEVKLAAIDKNRQTKEEELRTLERKLVVLLEEQQNELRAIKRKQDVRGALLAASHDQLNAATAPKKGGGNLQITDGSEIGSENGPTAGALVSGGGGGGPSAKEKKQAAQLMQSTETLMKFGFMSMSMTYFSSLNMIKAMRTVSAQDTVMAALSDVQSQRAAKQIPGSEGSGNILTGGVDVNNPDQLGGNEKFMPGLKPGAMPGQESLHVSSWSVEDCAKWLQTLSLGQYSEAFVDAAVDGEFLYDLNDDDLKNTLGVEHRLHRKKILNCVHRLKIAEAARDQRVGNMLHAMGTDKAPVLEDEPMDHEFDTMDTMQAQLTEENNEQQRLMTEGPKISMEELFSIVRHSKYPLLKEALDYLPRKDFDKTLVSVPYIEDNGTAYKDAYDKLAFHINKVDEHGNTMLTLACQNGNVKVTKFLMSKGANPNHQNNQGQTPAHFAVAYQFFDLSTWMFANGASDTVENKFGLTPYDGLSPDG